MQIDATLLDDVIAVVKQAGEAVLPYYQGLIPLDIATKADNTAVTAADRHLDQLLRSALSPLLPDVPILSEEGVIPSFTERHQWPRYWCVDPIDGTRGFIDKSDEFCINVALIEQHQPILGVVYAPAKSLCYAAAKDLGALVERDGQRRPLLLQPKSSTATPVWLVGHFIDKGVVQQLQQRSDIEIQQCHSAIKLGYIAEGIADCYPKKGPTSEWDIAAGQIIIEEAGGAVLDFEAKPLQYNARESLLNPPFVALGDPSQFATYLQFFQSLRRKI